MTYDCMSGRCEQE
jgi:hypothetical protein